MAKKAKKKTKKPTRRGWYQMVIRVRVPKSHVPGMKIYGVRGLDERGYLRELEILSAYYDIKGQPDATPPS